jgi:uncharacterized protein
MRALRLQMGMEKSIAERLDSLDWGLIAGRVETWGHARTGPLLGADECNRLIALYDRDRYFRNTVDMARYRFGEGQYRYFDNPLPPLVADLRRALYGHLAPIANDMASKLPGETNYPSSLEAYSQLCHDAGQTKPTPLLLRYEAGGYNRLHQDLYGALHFPLQAVILLNRREVDFTGGEFLLLEQQPRAQSIGQAVTLDQGEMLLFPVRERPVQGKRGYYRAPMRHGVSRLHTGRRHTLGLIFHDAE